MLNFIQLSELKVPLKRGRAAKLETSMIDILKFKR